MSKTKPKRDPERELYNRWIIKVILYATVGLVLMMAGCFVLAVIAEMLKTIAVGVILIFELEQLKGIQDALSLLVAMGLGGLALVGILQYDEYNEERIKELETIVEGKSNEIR